MGYNLKKDNKYVFNRVVNDVILYDYNVQAGSAGHLGKSSVSIKIVPRTIDLIDGSKLQLGYDMTFEIISEQLYSAFEFDKLKNKQGLICLPDIPLWIGTTTGGMIRFNVEVDVAPGENKGQVKISGSKFGSKLNDLIGARWDGAVFEPWAVSEKGAETQSPITPNTFTYEYVLDTKNKWVEFLDPTNPQVGDDLHQVRIALLGNIGSGASESVNGEDVMGQRTSPISNLVVKLFTEDGWVTLLQGQEYGLNYINGYYYVLIINTSSYRLSYGSKIRISFTP
ncbi:MAG: hypothetical protein NZM09_12110 [Ignavibacterium sp.]|nr:hypothetical protein [Ignavibacterium sp.]MDW8376419.1 hypothetical protein [Ignavibacteriales bacterium]